MTRNGRSGAGRLFTASLTERPSGPANAVQFVCGAGAAGVPAAALRRREAGTGAAA